MPLRAGALGFVVASAAALASWGGKRRRESHPRTSTELEPAASFAEAMGGGHMVCAS